MWWDLMHINYFLNFQYFSKKFEKSIFIHANSQDTNDLNLKLWMQTEEHVMRGQCTSNFSLFFVFFRKICKIQFLHKCEFICRLTALRLFLLLWPTRDQPIAMAVGGWWQLTLNDANDSKTFLKHFSDCLFYFCSTCVVSISNVSWLAMG